MNDINEEMAIRKLVANYADGVNRYDADTWVATWAPDAQWQLRQGQVIQGTTAILEFWCSVMDTLKFAIMIPGSAQLNIDGKHATGRWYMVEIVQEKNGRGAEIVGVYNDHYAKIHDQWHFQSRHYHMLYDSPTHPDAKHLPIPTAHLVAV